MRKLRRKMSNTATGSTTRRVTPILATEKRRPSKQLFEYEGHFHDYLVLHNAITVYSHFLFFYPRTSHIPKCCGRPLDALLDCILETLLGFGADLSDSGNGHE